VTTRVLLQVDLEFLFVCVWRRLPFGDFGGNVEVVWDISGSGVANFPASG
jgi:hypothetical protein